MVAGAVVLTLVVRLIAACAPAVDVPAVARLVGFMPFAIRLHLAVSMVGLLSLGFYLSSATDLEADFAGIVLGATMAAVAVTMAARGRYCSLARAAPCRLRSAAPSGKSP